MVINLHESLSITPPFRVMRLTDDENGLSIEIEATRGGVGRFQLLFDGPYGYRSFDEGDLINHLKRLGIEKSGLYELHTSDFLDWAGNENTFNEIPTGLKQYAIVSSDAVVEVLAFEPPEVSNTTFSGNA